MSPEPSQTKLAEDSPSIKVKVEASSSPEEHEAESDQTVPDAEGQVEDDATEPTKTALPVRAETEPLVVHPEPQSSAAGQARRPPGVLIEVAAVAAVLVLMCNLYGDSIANRLHLTNNADLPRQHMDRVVPSEAERLLDREQQLISMVSPDYSVKPADRHLVTILLQLGELYDRLGKSDEAIDTLDRAFATIEALKLTYPADVVRKEPNYLPIWALQEPELKQFEVDLAGFRLAELKDRKARSLWYRKDYEGAQKLCLEALKMMEQYAQPEKLRATPTAYVPMRLNELRRCAGLSTRYPAQLGLPDEIIATRERMVKVMASVPQFFRERSFDAKNQEFLANMDRRIRFAASNKQLIEQGQQPMQVRGL